MSTTANPFIVDLQDQPIQALFEQLHDRANNPAPFFGAVGEDMVERIKQRFVTASTPDGQRWKANAIATMMAYLEAKGGFGKNGKITKRGQGLAMNKRPLQGESGDLARENHWQANSNELIVGNSMIYAAIQHAGGQAGRGHKVTIPARPFMPITPNNQLYPSEQALVVGMLQRFIAGN